MPEPAPLSTPDDVVDLANGFMAPRALLAAARTDIFGALAGGPRTAAEVAAARGLDARATGLLLLALEGLGLLEKAAAGDDEAGRAPRVGGPARRGVDDAPAGGAGAPAPRFALAPLARECLVPGSPRDLTDYLRLDADTFESWSRLEESLASGRPVEVSSRAARAGEGGRHRAFIRGMRSTALGNAPLCAAGLDWAALLGGRAPRALLDLGGGPGTYALHFCRRWKEMRATVLDLPEAVAIAREVLRGDAAGEPDLAARISFLEADFHADPLGGPYDVAWLSHVVHGHPEETLAPLLARVRGALATGGVLAVHDFVLEEGRARPPYAALFGVNMLVMSDRGRTYSEGELRALLERAGFADVRRRDLGERRGISVVTARRS